VNDVAFVIPSKPRGESKKEQTDNKIQPLYIPENNPGINKGHDIVVTFFRKNERRRKNKREIGV
jgi:hypothetical protein